MESDYKIVRELGKGAFGTVYLIKHKTQDDVFALKAVDLRKASSEEKKSAEKEAKVMRELDHDHVVRYVESYFKGSTLFIFTEYCEGGDMAHFLEDTSDKLPEQLIVCWVYQTVSALKYLHAKKILHRDLKPQNIYLSGGADIKLGDLGIARVLDKAADMATTMAGTPCYMSPEIFQMKGYDHKTDIWSFGCVVYELAAGERAFDAPLLPFLMFKVTNGIVPPIDSSYSRNLRALVQSMMAKKPEERPSASELLERSPLKEFALKKQRPKEFISKIRTKWGTDKSSVDLLKLLLGMRFIPPSTFKESDIQIPVDSLRRYRQRTGRAAPLRVAEPAAPRGAVGGDGPGIYQSIMAPKVKPKVVEKNVDVTVKQDKSKAEVSGGRAAIMEAMKETMRDQPADSTLTVPAPSVSGDPDLDSTSESSKGRTTKKAVEAQFLMKQIQVLQKHCAEGLGQDTVMQAYSIMDSVSNPVQLKASLVRLMGDDKFRLYGDKIMYLRLFEVGLDKVKSQLQK